MNVRLLIQARFHIAEVDEWMNKVDLDNNGRLTYEEFKKSLGNQVNIIN